MIRPFQYFLRDPSGAALELKAFHNPGLAFAP